MSQPPPSFGPPPGYSDPPAPPTQQQQTTSIAAVFSLICGILGCFVITGLIAVITGIMGLSATKNPAVKGRGLAIAGIITGVLFGLGGAACFGTSAFVWLKGKDAILASVTATQFVEASTHGNQQKAQSFVDPAKVTQADVDGFVSTMALFGVPNRVETDGVPAVTTVNGVKQVTVGFTLHYPTASTHVGFDLTKQPDGSYKIVQIHEGAN